MERLREQSSDDPIMGPTVEDPEYYVDIPVRESVENEDQHMTCVASFSSREAAIAYAQKHFGADENGNICLVSGA